MNKISQEPLKQGSCYLIRRFYPRCIQPDHFLIKLSKFMTELSPLSVFLILTRWKLVNRIPQEPLELGS